MDIEAALYNEHTLAWEPFIEPTHNKKQTYLSPWNIRCSIAPVRLINRSFEIRFDIFY
jgi:hypothetical protein